MPIYKPKNKNNITNSNSSNKEKEIFSTSNISNPSTTSTSNISTPSAEELAKFKEERKLYWEEYAAQQKEKRRKEQEEQVAQINAQWEKDHEQYIKGTRDIPTWEEMQEEEKAGVVSHNIWNLNNPFHVDYNYFNQKYENSTDSTIVNRAKLVKAFYPQIGSLTPKQIDEVMDKPFPALNELKKQQAEHYLYLYGKEGSDENLYSDYIQILGEDKRKKGEYDPAKPYKFSKDIENIKKSATVISDYYRQFKDSDKVSLSDKDWYDLSLDYNARIKTYGKFKADEWLQYYMQDHIAGNQSVVEKYWNGLRGAGAKAAGSIVGTVGAVYGLGEYLASRYYGYDDESFLTHIMDNPVTRYGNDVSTYGTLSSSYHKDAKKFYGGRSAIPILQTREQEDAFFDINTLPQILDMSGYTAGMMTAGKAVAAVVGKIFKGVRYISGVNKAAQTAEQLRRSIDIAEKIKRAEKIAYGFGVPGIVGTFEGLTEGLNAKYEVLDSYGLNVSPTPGRSIPNLMNSPVLLEQFGKYATIRTKQLKEENPKLSDYEIQKIVSNEFKGFYEDLEARIIEQANQAGATTFMVNSVLNGLLNVTFKAGLQAAPVQKVLRNSKWTKWMYALGDPNTSGTFGDATVSPGTSWYRKALSTTKEVAGEFIEEGSQTITTDVSSDVAHYNIDNYITHKYDGDSTIAVGDFLSGTLSVAWNTLGESVTSKETIESGLMGALGSVVGSFDLPRSTVKLDADGNVVYKRNSQGELMRDERNRPIPEKIWFGRGQNSEGKMESRWEALRRMTPWRSGLMSNITESREDLKKAKTEAELIQDWLNNPDNVEKYTNVASIASWGKDLGRSAASGDEFEYRNSVLGKTIQDVEILQKIKGSAMYEEVIKNIVLAANAESGSQEAKDMVESIKTDPTNSADFEGMSDEEIFNTMKKNANNLLNTINEIQQESENLDRILVDVDSDTKISLIYAKMAMKDWDQRSEQLGSEIAEISKGIDNTVEASELSKEQKEFIANSGSIEGRVARVAELKSKISSLNADINSIESRKKVGETERKVLEDKKGRVKRLNSQVAALEKTISEYEGLNTVLNESEILSLSPEARANMLNPKNKSAYSEAQQAVIQNVIDKGTVANIDFSNKVKDSGKINAARKRYLRQYNDVLNDPESFNVYSSNARAAAADALSNKRYENLSKLEDYTAFSKELDDIFENSTIREKQLIEHHLKRDKNSNYEKYTKQQEDLLSLVTQISQDEYFNDMDENDLKLFSYALSYLSNQGIDITNVEAGKSLLMQTDSEGNNLFKKYVEENSAKASEEDKVEYTSEGEVVQVYADAVNRTKKDQSEKKRVEEEIPTASVDSDKNTPAPPVKVATNSDQKAENKNTDSESNEPSSNTTKLENFINSYKKKYSGDKGKDLSQEIENQLRNIIDNTESLDDLSPSEVAELLNSKANGLASSSGDDVVLQASEVLRQIAAKITEGKTTSVLDPSEQTVETPNTTGKNKHPNSSSMTSVDMEYVLNNYPNGALADFYKRWGVKEFLEKGVINKDSEVVFISDPQLLLEVEENLKLNNSNKSIDIYNIPVIAAVEVESGGMIIDGKHYQPIAIMPNTNSEDKFGALRLHPIRQLIFKNKDSNQAFLVKDDNGNIVNTNMADSKPIYIKPKQISESEDNSPVLSTLIDDLYPEEKEELDRVEKKEDKRKTSAYKKIRKRFLSKLGLKEGNNGIVYKTKNQEGEDVEFNIFITPLHKTKDSNSDKTIGQLFNENDVSVLDANSRLRRASKALHDFFKDTFDISDLSYEEDDAGNDVPTEESLKKLEGYAKNLKDKISKFLILPAKQGWQYQLKVTNESIRDRRLFELSIVDNAGNTIVLGNVTKGSMTPETQMSILKNLIMSPDGTVRMANEKESLVKWNVPYNDVTGTSDMAKSNMKDIFDDEILESSKTSFEYKIAGVKITAPFTKDDAPNYFSDRRNNVTRAKNSNKSVATENSVKNNNSTPSVSTPIVDSDTGANINTPSTSSENSTPSTPVTTNESNESKENKEESKEESPKNDGKVAKRDRRRKNPKYREESGKAVNIFNKEKELEWLDRVLPQVSKEGRIIFSKGLIKVAKSGKLAWGKFENGILTISDVAAEGTIYHEAFHEVFDSLLTENERQALLDEYRRGNKGLSNLELEELLAEDFREFVMQGGQDTRSLGRKVLDFFKSLFIKTKYWGNFKPSSMYYFNAINQGKYANKTREESSSDSASRTRLENYTEEMQQIKDQAIANGTFMKAPNGKPTNLNERQWLQVRTKAFKEWFGDWINPYNTSIQVGLDIDIESADASGFGSMGVIILTDKNNPLQGEMIGTIPMHQQIKSINDFKFTKYIDINSVLGSSYIEEEFRGKGFGKAAYWELGMWLSRNGSILRSAKDNSRTEAATRVWKSLERDGFAKKVEDRYEFVNNTSKVIDENGEPLVVYHHTDNPNLTMFSTDFDNYFSQSKGGTKKAIFFDENPSGTLDRKYDIPVFLNIRNLTTYIGTKEDLHKKGTDYTTVVNESAEKDSRYGGLHMSKFDDNKLLNQDVWIIHNANNVKSAIDNIGTFNPNNDDIRYREVNTSDIKSDGINTTAENTSDKFAWGEFRGASMSVEDITRILKGIGVTTKEQWESFSEKEKERTFECCGIL